MLEKNLTYSIRSLNVSPDKNVSKLEKYFFLKKHSKYNVYLKPTVTTLIEMHKKFVSKNSGVRQDHPLVLTLFWEM